jgi:3-oxoacyl-[acyl-carrier-protein] synthase II
MREEVVVTGLGVVSAAGVNVATFWDRLLRCDSGVRRRSESAGGNCATPFEAAVDENAFGRAKAELGGRNTERVVTLMSLACRQAWRDAGFQGPAKGRLSQRAGVILGSGLGGIQFQEEQMWRLLRTGDDRIHPHTVPRVSTTAMVTDIAQALELRGPGFVVSSACASAAHALGQAMRTIAYGDADVVVSGGAEAPLSEFSMRAFSLLGVLARSPGDPASACKPFDERRDGFVLGEGAAALVLEAAHHARKRGARIYARFAGYGQSLGAYHAVHARPDGEDAALAMQLALQDAGIAPEQIGYVNAHGTGTRENDAAESRAIRSVFGVQALHLPVSSTKPVTGHTLGAAGALEAVATVKTIETGIAPPSGNYLFADPACALCVATEPTEVPKRSRYALSNSFGFGNVNATLLFAGEDS